MFDRGLDIHATAFIRNIVKTNKEITRNDIKTFINLLRNHNVDIQELDAAKIFLNTHVENKINYFIKKEHLSKVEEYKKIQKMIPNFINYYKNHKQELS